MWKCLRPSQNSTPNQHWNPALRLIASNTLEKDAFMSQSNAFLIEPSEPPCESLQTYVFPARLNPNGDLLMEIAKLNRKSLILNSVLRKQAPHTKSDTHGRHCLTLVRSDTIRLSNYVDLKTMDLNSV